MGNFLAEVKRSFDREVCFDDNRYHNAKLLLSLYGTVTWRTVERVQEFDDECYAMSGKRLSDLIDCLVDVDTTLDKERYEAHLRSFARTKAIIEMVDKSLVMLKNYPKYGDIYFNILYYQYVIDNSYTEKDMLDLLHMEKSTFYRRKKDAVNLFGAVLWGYVLPELKELWLLGEIDTQMGLSWE